MAKRCLMLIICYAIWYHSAVAQSEAIIIATEAYQEGDYQTTASIFSELIAEGYRHSELYINLGHAYYQMGDWGRALVNYLRAQALEPRHSALQQAITRIRLQQNGALPTEVSFAGQLGTLTETWLTTEELQALTFISWNLFFGGISILAIRRTSWRWAIIALSPLAIASSVMLGLYSARAYLENAQPRGVIITEKVDVKSGPSEHYLTFFSLNAAIELRMLSTKEGWAHIRTIDGREGWVQAETIALVDEERRPN